VALDFIVQNSQVFLLVFVRILAIIELAPVISSVGVPQIAKIGLAFFASVVVFPNVMHAGYPIPQAPLEYALLVMGEAMVGVIISFFLVVIYSAFLAVGEFFSVQTGFGFTQTFDVLAQVEIPIEGQFINIIAMYVFIAVGGFQKLFLLGIAQGFEKVRAVDLVVHRNDLFPMVLGSLGVLFQTALIMSLPVVGTLLLVSVGMGLLGKAAPQMNLLMMGFPIAITVSFVVLFLITPFMVDSIAIVIQKSFDSIARLLTLLQGAKQ